MTQMKLSTISIIVGAVLALLHCYGVMKPAAFSAWLRRFPRFTALGYPLVIGATGWFLYYVSLESVSDFANLKNLLYLLFGAVGIGTCIFVQDYLPVRGLAALLLVVAKWICDAARFSDTSWRLVIVTMAYIWVVCGIWFTVSPWRLRDIIQWVTVSEGRVRLVSLTRFGLGILLVILGLTVFRADEARAAALGLGQNAPSAAQGQ